jgi:hypothetical protein
MRPRLFALLDRGASCSVIRVAAPPLVGRRDYRPRHGRVTCAGDRGAAPFVQLDSRIRRPVALAATSMR